MAVKSQADIERQRARNKRRRAHFRLIDRTTEAVLRGIKRTVKPPAPERLVLDTIRANKGDGAVTAARRAAAIERHHKRFLARAEQSAAETREIARRYAGESVEITR